MNFDVKFQINEDDLTQYITEFLFVDRRTYYEYSIILDKYYILSPYPKDSQITLILNDQVIFDKNTNVDFEIVVRETGSTVRIRINKQ